MHPAEGATKQPHDDPAFFREAVRHTAGVTGFIPRLIEKDYFCTVLLEYLAGGDPNLVFKGGTCLAKVHGDFYRLSEDLDFTVPTPAATKRRARSACMTGLKAVVDRLPKSLSAFAVTQPLTGSNGSTQYNAEVRYTSMIDGRSEPVKIEVSLREPLFERIERLGARTLLLNPLDGEPLVPPCLLACLSLREAYAEKIRAALSRQEAAIRDYFDLDHAVRAGRIDPADAALAALARAKLAIPDNPPPDLSEARLDSLRLQLEPQLQPVLRSEDYEAFDLERAFNLTRALAARITGKAEHPQ